MLAVDFLYGRTTFAILPFTLFDEVASSASDPQQEECGAARVAKK
jgi:hypothetical protein